METKCCYKLVTFRQWLLKKLVARCWQSRLSTAATKSTLAFTLSYSLSKHNLTLVILDNVKYDTVWIVFPRTFSNNSETYLQNVWCSLALSSKIGSLINTEKNNAYSLQHFCMDWNPIHLFNKHSLIICIVYLRCSWPLWTMGSLLIICRISSLRASPQRTRQARARMESA